MRAVYGDFLEIWQAGGQLGLRDQNGRENSPLGLGSQDHSCTWMSWSPGMCRWPPPKAAEEGRCIGFRTPLGECLQKTEE